MVTCDTDTDTTILDISDTEIVTFDISIKDSYISDTEKLTCKISDAA